MSMGRASDASDDNEEELFRTFFEEPVGVNPLKIASRISDNLFDVIVATERQRTQAPLPMRRRSYTEHAILNSFGTDNSPAPAAGGQRHRRGSLTQHSVPLEQLNRQHNNAAASQRHRQTQPCRR